MKICPMWAWALSSPLTGIFRQIFKPLVTNWNICTLFMAHNTNCRGLWEFDRGLWAWPSPNPHSEQGYFWVGLLRTLSSQALDVHGDWDFTASLGSCPSATPLSQWRILPLNLAAQCHRCLSLLACKRPSASNDVDLLFLLFMPRFNPLHTSCQGSAFQSLCHGAFLLLLTSCFMLFLSSSCKQWECCCGREVVSAGVIATPSSSPSPLFPPAVAFGLH